jgi:radical SAM protein with 4Fe4S-binding SPASM domain
MDYTVNYPYAIFNIELTNRCPFRCVMCARTHAMKRPQGDMTFDVYSSIVDQYLRDNLHIASNYVTWLHGFGESMQHILLFECIRYASSRGMKVGLSLNPLMLTRSLAKKLLMSCPDTLVFSLDGSDNKSFEAIRGIPNAYDKSRQRLLDFLSLKRALCSNTKVILSIINFPMNEGFIDDNLSFWRSQSGIDEVDKKPFTIWDGSVKAVNQFRKRPILKQDRVSCSIPFSSMTVAWNGDVTPCCYDFDVKEPLGNVKDKPLIEIWNDEPIQRLREQFATNNVTSRLCRQCPQLYEPYRDSKRAAASDQQPLEQAHPN